MKKLDSIDLDILAALYADSSVTNKELANKVNIAASTCLERVKRLSSAGVIRRFGLDVNYISIAVKLLMNLSGISSLPLK